MMEMPIRLKVVSELPEVNSLGSNSSLIKMDNMMRVDLPNSSKTSISTLVPLRHHSSVHEHQGPYRLDRTMLFLKEIRISSHSRLRRGLPHVK